MLFIYVVYIYTCANLRIPLRTCAHTPAHQRAYPSARVRIPLKKSFKNLLTLNVVHATIRPAKD
nr:MAG TPA: hypothetical protein [Caudoviricetes sp.]